jgi:hypothetical protein
MDLHCAIPTVLARYSHGKLNFYPGEQANSPKIGQSKQGSEIGALAVATANQLYHTLFAILQHACIWVEVGIAAQH